MFLCLEERGEREGALSCWGQLALVHGVGRVRETKDGKGNHAPKRGKNGCGEKCGVTE